MERTSEIGPSIVIRGELFAGEDVVLSGRIEGTVKMEGHRLMVSQGAHVKAEVRTRELVVSGVVDPADVDALARRHFGDWPRGQRTPPAQRPVAPVPKNSSFSSNTIFFTPRCAR